MNDEYGVNKGVPNPIIKQYEVLLRVAIAARDLHECLEYDEDAEEWSFVEKDDEDHKLWAAIEEAKRLDLL